KRAYRQKCFCNGISDFLDGEWNPFPISFYNKNFLVAHILYRLFTRKTSKKYINAFGRSSDLLRFLNAFPFRLVGTVAMEMFVQHVKKSLQQRELLPIFTAFPFILFI